MRLPVVLLLVGLLTAGCAAPPAAPPQETAPPEPSYLWERGFRGEMFVGHTDQCMEPLGCLSNTFSTVLVRVPDNSTLKTLDFDVQVGAPRESFHWAIKCRIGRDLCPTQGPTGFIQGDADVHLHLTDLNFPATADAVWSSGDNYTFPQTLTDQSSANLKFSGTALFHGGPPRTIEQRIHAIDYDTNTGPCVIGAEPYCNTFFGAGSTVGSYPGLLHELNLTATWKATPLDQSIQVWVRCYSNSQTTCVGGNLNYIFEGPSPLAIKVPDLDYQGGSLVLEIYGEGNFPKNLQVERTPVHMTGSVVEEVAIAT
jgi:hypothetical protein